MTHERGPRDGRDERTTRAVAWGLAAVSASLGIAHLAGVPLLVERFAAWGFPDVFRTLIGLVLLFGAVGLLRRQSATVASTLIGMVMLGAIFTHLFVGNPLFAIVPALYLAVLVWVGKRRLETPFDSQSPNEVPPSVV